MADLNDNGGGPADDAKPGPAPEAAQQMPATFSGDINALAAALHETNHQLSAMIQTERKYDGPTANLVMVGAAAQALAMAAICGARDGEAQRIMDGAVMLAQGLIDKHEAERQASGHSSVYNPTIGHA